MSDRIPFNLKIVASDEPLRNDPFYAYLEKHATKGGAGTRLDRILDYLQTLGFVKGTHTLDEDQIKTLEYVFEQWYDFTPWGEPQPVGALFWLSTPLFYVRGLPDHRGITPYLKELVQKSGWIYDVTPDTTYFEIIENRLYAKYQTILGSRFLCVIEGEIK